MGAAEGRAVERTVVTHRWPLCIWPLAEAAFSPWLSFCPSLCIWKADCVASDFLLILSKENWE